MITVTKVDGSKLTINADEIETIESTHDTLVSLISGKKIVVRESSNEIITLVIDYRRKCNQHSDNEKVK